MPFDPGDDQHPNSQAEDDHPYTVIREWKTPVPPAEEEEKPRLAPEKTAASAQPRARETIMADTVTAPPLAETASRKAVPPRKKKRRTPLFFIVWGLVIAAAIVIILLFVKRGVDASGVQTPEYASRPQAEESSQSPAGVVPEPVLPPAERFRQTVEENSPVMFIADRETWMAGEEAKLNRIIAALPGLHSAALTVTGHTADAGKPNAQFVLSAERAIAVRDYLLKHRDGINLDITIIGRGANDPAVTGVSGGPPVPLAEQAANRRAVIRVDKAE